MPKILVVDDSAVERRLVGGLLEKEDRYDLEFVHDGRAALESIGERLPDLLLTDLRMPDIDGLQLVRELRLRESDLPVILMTAHGSETIAIDALKAGAASYVPKDQLADSLVDSIEKVLAIGSTSKTSTELTDCLSGTQLEFELENDPSLIEPLVHLVQEDIQGVGFFNGATRLQLAIALEHALLNAMYRGNLEVTTDELEAARECHLLGKDTDPIQTRRTESPYCDRRLHVNVSVGAEEVRFVVRDDGPGFDVAAFANPSPDVVAQGGQGRGILLMRTFMDDVSYNDTGNEVTMVKSAGG
jgi:CheY-like chemotaxis protein